MAECLSLAAVSAGYGETVVIEGVSLTLGDDGLVSVLGRNGVGKTTLLATIMGHTTLHRGRIAFRGADLALLPIHRRARAGIGYVPQEREIFPSLTVEENLRVAAGGSGGWSEARVFDLFPNLGARRRNMGNQLSGGEQQMLAIGRALMGNPRLLLMDEPLEGLAPVIVDEVLKAMERLRGEGDLAIVLVEQHASIALDFAPRAVILDRGQIVHDGDSVPLRRDPVRLAELIGVAG